MSSYADYAEISRDFDKTRRPVGTGLLLKALRQVPTALNRMAVLDAGCGTGSYCKALDGVVGSITGVDLNPKMIGVARRKFDGGGRKTRVSFELGSVTSLPFDDGRFGAVMVNQVLHHLPDHPRAGYPMHRAAIREFARVLKPGGVLVVNTSAARQCLEGFWFYHLIREAAARLAERFAGLKPLAGMLEDSRLSFTGSAVPDGQVLQGAAYFNSLGPLDEAWRAGDSAWSLATPGELKRSLEWIRELDDSGVLRRQAWQWDAPRRKIGQQTFLFAVRK